MAPISERVDPPKRPKPSAGGHCFLLLFLSTTHALGALPTRSDELPSPARLFFQAGIFFAPGISRHALFMPYFLIAFSSTFAYYTLFMGGGNGFFQPAFQDMNTN